MPFLSPNQQRQSTEGTSRASEGKLALWKMVVRTQLVLIVASHMVVVASSHAANVDCYFWLLCECGRISLMLLKCCRKQTPHRTLDCLRTLTGRHREWPAAASSLSWKYWSVQTHVPPSSTEKSGLPSWILYWHCGRNWTRFADNAKQSFYSWFESRYL